MLFKVPIYLDDGDYTFDLSIINYYNLESKPTTGTIFVQTQKPSKIGATYEILNHGVKFKFIPQGVSKFYILRDGIPIKKLTTETEWIDYAVNGNATYNIRAIDANDNFNDSEDIYVSVPLEYSVLSPVYDLSFMLPLKVLRDNPITQNGSVNYDVSNKMFAGREYPIAVFTQHKSHIIPLNYTFRTIDEFEIFKRIADMRTTLLYRSNKGDKVYGIIQSYEYNRDKNGIDVSFTVQRVDYNEQISYD